MSISIKANTDLRLVTLGNKPRPAFEYADGKRTDTTKKYGTHDLHTVEVAASMGDTALGAIRVSTCEPTAFEVPLGTVLDVTAVELTIRPVDAFNLAISAVVPVVTTKGAAAKDAA